MHFQSRAELGIEKNTHIGAGGETGRGAKIALDKISNNLIQNNQNIQI